MREKLIDAKPLMEDGWHLVKTGKSNVFLASMSLADVPTVDAAPVVHGEWDVIADDCTFDVIYQCSVCKEEFVTNDGTPAENLWHYCPNCGAKMDGGNEDV